MSTKRFYIGFHNMKLGNSLLKEVSHELSILDDCFKEKSSQLDTDEITNFLFHTESGEDRMKYGRDMITGSYLLLRDQNVISDTDNIYVVVNGDSGENITTQMFTGYVGNNQSAISYFESKVQKCRNEHEKSVSLV